MLDFVRVAPAVRRAGRYAVCSLVSWCVFQSLAVPSASAGTEVLFNKPIDRRFAWLGNDAQGSVDFQTEIINHINSATTSIDVATMTFGGVDPIADALKAKADMGVSVRIIGNRAHRTGSGYLRTLRGPAQIADNNLSALVARVNFQQNAGATPAGFLKDSGATYGAKPGGFSYGWSVDVAADMQNTAVAGYSSTLLGQCYARQNNITRTWEFGVPNGSYYVHFVCGQPGFSSKPYIQVEGQDVFKFAGFFGTYLNLGPGEFGGATVEGGEDSDFPGVANSKRIQVNDGRLTFSVGQPGQAGWTSLCYVEIYRGDAAEAYGDTFDDVTLVQERGLQHSKFILVDGATAAPRLWVGSGNLTSAMTFMSEDAIRTDDTAICAAFRDQFNQMWGAASGTPNPVTSRFGRYKVNPVTNLNVLQPYFATTFPWRVMFSPGIAGLNLGSELESYLNGTQKNLIFMMEQFTDGGPSFGQNTSGYLLDVPLNDVVVSGKPVYGVFGNSNLGDAIFTQFAAASNVDFAQEVTVSGMHGMHNKFCLRDAIGDTRFTSRGRLVEGSMNWSQGGMVINDEQTFRIDDPAIANKYLQRAISSLGENGITLDRSADVILVIDRSYSMTALTDDGVTTRIEAAKSAAKLFVDLLDSSGNHRASVIRFGEIVEPFMPPLALAPLTDFYKTQLKNAIDTTFATLPIGNWTCYGVALQDALSQFNFAMPPKPRRFIHFFTDGMQNKAPMAETVYPDLRDIGVEIHSTAFGSFDLFGGGPTSILATMATDTGGTFAQVENDATQLSKRFVEVARDAMSLDTLLDPTHVISKEVVGTDSVDVGVETRTLKFVCSWDATKEQLATQTIYGPWGQKIDAKTPGVKFFENRGYQLVAVDLALLSTKLGVSTEGTWRVVTSPGAKWGTLKSLAVDVIVLGDSDVDFQSEVQASRAGDPNVTLLCRTLFDGEPLAGGKVSVNWTLPMLKDGTKTENYTLALVDDGKHGDGKAGDGLFGTTVKLPTPGNHRFHFVAESSAKGEKVPTLAIRRESTLGYTVDLK